MRTRNVFWFGFLTLWPWQAALTAEGPLATRSGSFRSVTMPSGRPTFHIPPDCRLARNEQGLRN